MNRARLLVLLPIILSLFETYAGGASKAPDIFPFLGRQYVRLADWARANSLELRWIKQDETVQLTNSRFKIAFTINSTDCDFNGVDLRLLFAIASREGAPCVSQLDAQNTLAPLLYPPRNRRGVQVKKICLDPGHGGDDPGYRVGSVEEKKYTLLLAQELRDQLVKAGFQVSLTRTTDKRVDLPVRPDLARRRGADLFVSLHFNAFPQKPVQGTEVYCLTPAGAPSTNARGEGAGAGRFAGNRFNDKNMCLAYQVQKSLIKNLGTEDRGVHRARFAVLKDAEMPAILIEAGFLSHPTEGRKILDPAYRRKMARAILEGIQTYKQQVERSAD